MLDGALDETLGEKGEESVRESLVENYSKGALCMEGEGTWMDESYHGCDSVLRLICIFLSFVLSNGSPAF